MSEIEARLAELERVGLGRRLRLVSGPQGPTVLLEGKPVMLLCSNNYLGLADHPRVREAAADAAMRWGVGAGASRLVSGNMTIHRRLEERLAAFEQADACVLVGSGYLANLGMIPILAGPGGVVLSDRLNHASIIDGCRLARAETVVYDHCDTEHLAWALHRAQGREALIVTDSVFSMDGDVAPLPEIVELAREGFEVAGSATQIVPLMVGDPDLAMRLCQAAIEEGVFAQAIRPPTVPDGTSRLRLAVMASHSRSELRQAAAMLARAALGVGFDPVRSLPLAIVNDALPAAAGDDRKPRPG